MTKKIMVIFLLLVTACTNEPSVDDKPEKKWKNIPELDGIDIWDVKIYNDEIYVAGRSIDGKGIIYKSTNAINWTIYNTAIKDSLDRGVMAIDFYNGNLIACFTGKPVYLVTSDHVTPLTKPILNDVREMIVDNENNILIGSFLPGFFCKYISSDSTYNIYDSLFTPSSGGCSKQAGISGGISVSKFLKDINSGDILIGNFSFDYHFVTAFSNRTIDCYPTDGLSPIDRFHGCHDIIFINDTLFAAGKANIKYLDQNVWKTFGDSLPKTIDSGLAIATSIAYDEVKQDIYVSANYIGVVKWFKNSGWKTLNEGLESFQGYYDFI
ncbi:MAG: hypothetical protein Q8M94_19410, partial [Ignavibacteria bacterium]|nr:hypothetical protein [Ignavibacteria bacterium]